jgi:peptide/nickel transport system substrate-binding protein
MLSRRIWLGFTVLAMAFGLIAVAACGDDATPEVIEREVIVTQEVIREVEVEAKGPVITGEARPGGSLVFGGCVDTGTLHPHMHFVGHCEPGAIAIYESLVEGNWTEARPELQTENPPAGPIPVLAESWELSDDKLTLTFHLRRGVKFHDGSDFNAEVAEMNYRSLIDEDYEFYNPRGAGFVSWTTGFIDSVRAVDDYTFEMKLTQPNFGAIDRFQVWPCCAMISGEAIRTMTPEEIGENPVGTGHFKFKSWEKGEALVLERNDDYWGEKALLDQLVVVPIVDEVARLAALVAGEIDIAVNLAPENLNLVRGLPGFEGYARLSWAYYGLNPNHREPPFDDLRVRQATSLCIDRETLSNDLMSGILKPGNQIWGVNPGRDPDAPLLPYDPDLAKQLLADAGYADGFDVDAVLTLRGIPQLESACAMWEAINIRCKIKNEPWSSYRPKNVSRSVDPGPFSNFIAPVIEPLWIMTLFHSSNNSLNLGFEHPEFQDMLDLARETNEDTERFKIQADITKWMFNNVMTIPLYDENSVFPLGPELDPWEQQGGGLTWLSNWEFAPHRKN